MSSKLSSRPSVRNPMLLKRKPNWNFERPRSSRGRLISQFIFSQHYNRLEVPVAKVIDRFKAIRKLKETLGINQRTPRDLSFIDIETTGPDLGFHEIIDLAVIRASTGGEIKQEWQRRIKPRFP